MTETRKRLTVVDLRHGPITVKIVGFDEREEDGRPKLFLIVKRRSQLYELELTREAVAELTAQYGPNKRVEAFFAKHGLQ